MFVFFFSLRQHKSISCLCLLDLFVNIVYSFLVHIKSIFEPHSTAQYPTVPNRTVCRHIILCFLNFINPYRTTHRSKKCRKQKEAWGGGMVMDSIFYALFSSFYSSLHFPIEWVLFYEHLHFDCDICMDIFWIILCRQYMGVYPFYFHRLIVLYWPKKYTYRVYEGEGKGKRKRLT